MRKLGAVIASFGLLLHAYTAFFNSDVGPDSFTLGLMAWSSLPYLVAMSLLFVLRRPLIPLCGVIPVLFFDVWNYYYIFVRPQSSTAAIGLLWMPLWNLAIFMPTGLLVGWLIHKAKTSKEKTSTPNS